MAAQPGRKAPARLATRQAGGVTAAATIEPCVGEVLDDRYRLERQLTDSIDRWAAVDDLLDRSVEIRFAAGSSTEGTFEALAPQIDARWLRLLDAGARGGLSWIVVEDPGRPTLIERVRTARLEPLETTELGLAVADTLLATHPAPAVPLTPDRIFIGSDGVRIDGIAGGAATTPTADNAVAAVGRLMFYALTGNWPGPSGPGVPVGSETTLVSPRRLRGGISRGLDGCVSGAITGRIPTLAELVRQLDQLPKPRAPREGPSPAILRLRRITAWLAPPTAVALLGLLAWTIGSNLGQIPGADLDQTPVHTLPTPQAHTAPALVWQTPPKVTAFGPTALTDHSPAKAAVDANPKTVWRTGALTTPTGQGVGILIDLGRPRTVTQATIALATGGSEVELRAGNRPPQVATDMPLVGQSDASGRQARVTLTRAVRARYWLVWLTKLPAVHGGFGQGISEIRLLRARSK